jgi:uncharacterized membrane protein YebE (DUF533 family)
MFDAKGLLDQFLGAGGGNDGDPRSRRDGGGFDLSRLGQMGQGNGLGGIAGGALAGGLAGILLGPKQGRKLAGSALTYGGLAVVGALAYKAYRDWQAGKSPATGAATAPVPMLPPPSDTPFNPATEGAQQALGKTLLRAMIAAAKADGHVDAKEQANIFAQMDRLALDADAKAFVIDELRAPLDVDSIARAVRTPEEAAEIYAASLLVIDLDHAAERGYLGMLAARLNLDQKLVDHLHATVAAAAAAEPVKSPVPTVAGSSAA